MTQRWALGPFVLDSAGTLELDGIPVALKPQQHLALLVLVEQGGLVSREGLSQALWPIAPPQDPGALAQVIHGLRRVLDRGPMGGQAIQTVYGKGYVYAGPQATLIGPSRPASPSPDPSSPSPDPTSALPEPAGSRSSEAVSPSILHREAWVRWRSGDPRQLAEVVRLLTTCLDRDPDHREALVDLCHSRLVQASWGMASTRTAGLELQALLARARALAVDTHTLAALHAETLTVLHWQAHRSDQLYGRWLPQRLPLDRPLLGWIRHLLFSGQADRALALLDTRLQNDLPQGWGLKSYAHIQRGEWPEAEAASRRQMHLRGDQAAPPLELALVVAQQGNSAAAAALVEQAGILQQQQLTSLHALAALALAHGPQHAQAAALLQRVARQHDRRPNGVVGALSLWGVGALALGESGLATRLLSAAVRGRCGLAPLVWHGPLLQPYAHEPAVAVFGRAMARACAHQGGKAKLPRNSSNKI